MSEEIKEILDYISDRVIPNEKWNAVKNYIKELQQKVEQLEQALKNSKDTYDDVTYEMNKKIEQLENIRKEAIDFVKENCQIIRYKDEYGNLIDKIGEINGYALLNILNKGSESDE